MSDSERFAEVAHQKCANERNAHFFEQMAHFSKNKKKSNSLRKPMSELPTLLIYQIIIWYIS